MKKALTHRVATLGTAAVLVAACAASPSQPPVTGANADNPNPLTLEYADAASLRNQLAYGTLQLEGTSQAVTPTQAQTLLPLWQGLAALSGSTTTTPEELTAVQDQIVAALSPEQLQAIADQRITAVMLSEFYAEHGLVLATPIPEPTKIPGSGSGVSPADKEATRTAAEALGTPTGAGTGQQAKTLLFDIVIALLAERAGN